MADGFDILGSVRAGQALMSPLDKLIKKQQELETTSSYNDAIVEHAKRNGLIDQEEYNKYLAGNHQQKTGIAAGIAANIHQQSQLAQINKANELTAAQVNLSDAHKQLLLSQLNETGPNAPNPYANTPIWTDDGSGNQVQVGLYDDKGTPHYFPYGHAGGQSAAAQFQPADEVRKAMGDAGFTFAPTSNRSGRWINTKGNADLDENGNPIYSADGTLFQSGGKMRPITEAMRIAKMFPAPNASATPKPTPVPAAAPPAAPPQLGEVRRGYKFKGGNPADPGSWEKVAGQ